MSPAPMPTDKETGRRIVSSLIVDRLSNGTWAICCPDCSRYDHTTYKTAAAAVGALTRLRKDKANAH